MQFKDFPINQAIGVVLVNDIVINGKVYRKGHIIDHEDKLLFKSQGILSVYGAVAEKDDIDFKTAQNQIAAQISGKGLGFVTQEDGVCKIVATVDGIFIVDEQRTNKFNRFNENVVLNIIEPYTTVQKDDVVAILDVATPFMKEEEIDDIIFRLSGNFTLLSVAEISSKKATFIYPHLLNDDNENMYFTSVVMKAITDFDDIGLNFGHEIHSKYDIDSISDSLYDCKNSDVVFVLSPLKSSSRNDVIYKAIEKYADRIINYKYPDVALSDFVIAEKGNSKVFVIPHSYDVAETKEIDKLIKYIMFSEYVDESIFQNKNTSIIGNIDKYLRDNNHKFIASSKKGQSKEKASVGIILLAAGRGSRCGRNKLLAKDEKGKPMLIKTLKSAIASNAKPVFVITGYDHDEIEEYMEGYDVNIVYNHAYETGIQSSISAGIKSIPASCDGAILLPADMPNITAQDINKLITKFDKNNEKSVCLFSYKGVKSNPVLWSKSLYSKAQIIPENAHMRTVLMEHNDYIKTIETKDSKKLLDINYPNQLKEYCEYKK